MAKNKVKEIESFHIDRNTTVGAVTLGVSQLDKMVQFYRQIIGLSIVNRTETSTELGIGKKSIVILEARPEGKHFPNSTGLFHLAILLPTRQDLGHWLNHLATSQYSLSGAGDHLVSEALYLSDPEGNGIEMYCDRPRESWEHDENGIKMATLPVDLESLRADAPADEFKGLPDETVMGHIHLKVDNVDKAMGFYRDLLGFELMAVWSGAAFLGAGGYHHHIGTNTWFSRGAPPLPLDSLGLVAYRIVLPNKEAHQQLLNRLDMQGYSIEHVGPNRFVRDPAGNGIILQVKES